AACPMLGVHNHRLVERSADVGRGKEEAVEAAGQNERGGESDPSGHGRPPRMAKGGGLYAERQIASSGGCIGSQEVAIDMLGGQRLRQQTDNDSHGKGTD